MQIEPFHQRHLESAAKLLADLLGLQGRDTGLRYRLSDAASTRAVIADAIRLGPGVVALDDDGVVGFMIAPLPSVPGAGGSRMTVVHHAASPPLARDTYRRMYERIAAALVAVGCFDHSVLVPASQPTVLEALFELQFGIDQIKGVRPLSGVVDTPLSEVLAHQIAAEDNIVLVACDGDAIVGMIQAQPDGLWTATTTIGMNVVTEHARSAGVGTTMLNALCATAATSGAEHCAVGWDSANPLSDPFYRARGVHASALRVTPHHRRPHRVGKRQPRLPNPSSSNPRRHNCCRSAPAMLAPHGCSSPTGQGHTEVIVRDRARARRGAFDRGTQPARV